MDDLARRYLFERMAFATLIRFSGPVTPAFLAEIARHRKTEFGTFSINAFEIVRTDKFLSNTGTETIVRIVVEHGQWLQSKPSARAHLAWLEQLRNAGSPPSRVAAMLSPAG